MASKRQKKKQQRKKLTSTLIQAGNSEKSVKNLTMGELQQKAKPIIAQNKRKQKNRKASKKYRDRLIYEREEKLEIIEKIIGVDRLDFAKRPTARWLDKMKLEDLRSGKYKYTDFPDYIPKKTKSNNVMDIFDFNKEYQLPKGKELQIAYRSLDGNKDIETEIGRYSSYSNEDLVAMLYTINSKGQTRRSRRGSSGQAGEGVIRMLSHGAVKELSEKQRDDNRRADNKYEELMNKVMSKQAKKKYARLQHSEIDYHWQYVQQVGGYGITTNYTSISARKLLIIGNAILWSILESDRQGFYRDFKTVCCKIIPDMALILP